MIPLLAVDTLASLILTCVCQSLNSSAVQIDEHPGCPCRQCLVPGQPAWDSCDNPCGPTEEAGGQLTVSLGRIYADDALGGPQSASRVVLGARGCGPAQMVAEFIITLLRCAPGPDENGCPPTCEELAAAARTLHVDSAAVHNALVCCLPQTAPNGRRHRFTLGQQRPVGPQGGCVGIEQRVTIALPNCACPPEES